MATALAVLALWPAGASAATTITEYTIPTPNTAPQGIVSGPDGALWFAEVGGDAIGRITTAGQVTNEFPVPVKPSQPTDIAVGPDGRLWFTELISSPSGKVGRLTTAGALNEFQVPPTTSAQFPSGITTGPDGALWFTEELGNQIGRITTAGAITNEYTIPTASSFPTEIAVGSDGAMWFTENLGSKIGRITTAGTIMEFPLQQGRNPEDIVAGPDGALWFTMPGANLIGRITTGGTVTEYPLASNSVPTGITVGSDNAIWFTEIGVMPEIGPRIGGNKIGRMTTAGVITNEYPIPTAASQPSRITAGPDGAIWFTEKGANKIGRLVRDITAPVTTILTAPTGASSNTTPTFTFSSSEPGSTFQCQLDGSAFLPCTSPLTLPALSLGKHTFTVRSIDPEGNLEPAPASLSFEIVASAPAALPPPVLGKSVNAVPLSGEVFFSPPPGSAARIAKSVPGLKGRNFKSLREARQLPVGTIFDTRKGKVRLTSARDKGTQTQSGEFATGVFQVLQSGKRSAKGLTELRLKGSSFRSCKGTSSRKSEVRSARSHRTIRRLKSSVGGRFRTRGRYSAATVRGTVWSTVDRCDGTLTSVSRGRVTVRDLRRKKNISVRAGKRYLAKAP